MPTPGRVSRTVADPRSSVNKTISAAMFLLPNTQADPDTVEDMRDHLVVIARKLSAAPKPG